MRSDHQLKQAVLEHLDCDPAINASHIGVAVRDGVVTLSGHVPSLGEEQAALVCAGQVKGVKAVIDQIEVELPGNCQTPDEVVAEQVHARLSSNKSVPIKQIQITVDNGTVTLRGQVHWQYQRRAAEEDLHKLACIRGIRNEIEIKPAVKAENVHDRIHQLLQRIAPTERDDIEVKCDGGRVVLSGTVNTWHEKSMIENAAWSVPGVTEVIDQVTVA